MVRFETRSFYSELQRRLDADTGGLTEAYDDVVRGRDVLQVTEADIAAAPANLCFGPYGASPIFGLHFDAADDSAAS
jgi:hypothetical protein